MPCPVPGTWHPLAPVIVVTRWQHLGSNIKGLKVKRPVAFASEEKASKMVTNFGYLF